MGLTASSYDDASKDCTRFAKLSSFERGFVHIGVWCERDVMYENPMQPTLWLANAKPAIRTLLEDLVEDATRVTCAWSTVDVEDADVLPGTRGAMHAQFDVIVLRRCPMRDATATDVQCLRRFIRDGGFIVHEVALHHVKTFEDHAARAGMPVDPAVREMVRSGFELLGVRSIDVSDDRRFSIDRDIRKAKSVLTPSWYSDRESRRSARYRATPRMTRDEEEEQERQATHRFLGQFKDAPEKKAVYFFVFRKVSGSRETV